MDGSEFITRQEHEEYAKRMNDEHERQNKRISQLEDDNKQNRSLVVSVEKMAVHMENMIKSQNRLELKVDKIEAMPAETSKQWRNAVISTIVGGGLGAIIASVISLL